MKKYILIVFSSALLTASFAQSWSLTGNTSTIPPTNFLGTKDSKALVFKTNNTERMRITPTGNGNVGVGVTNPVQRLDVNGNINIGKGFSLFMENRRVLRVDSINANIFLGNGTGNAITSGAYNTATGMRALAANTDGNFNSGYGAEALRFNTSGVYNTATGSFAMKNNTVGLANTASGVNALYSNTTGSYNVASGVSVLYSNTTGYNNSAYGYSALYYNLDGIDNVANGTRALYNNNKGSFNTAIGKEALFSNTAGSFNTATGYRALYSNTTNYYNTAYGWEALYSNTTHTNTATGAHALYSNTTGSYNTAVGSNALYRTTASFGNTAVGDDAGYEYNNGYYNTFIGSDADASSDGIYNSVALGSSAIVTAPNQVRIGNSYTTSIGGYTNWSNISDGRVKKNVKENVPGLAFINELKPVTYNLDLDAADKIAARPSVKDKDGKLLTIQPSQTEINARIAKQQVVYTGFVAQDVEKAAKELNYDFSGVDAAKSDKDLYALRYSDFVVPLVKAVQDLSKMSEGLRAENDKKDSIINDLKTRVEKLETMVMNAQSSTSVDRQQSIKISSASLEQNMPNPFRNATRINYELPKQFSSAKIIITDKSGKTLKEINVSGSGKGGVNVDASMLSARAYQYSLYINGKLMDTRQMVLLK